MFDPLVSIVIPVYNGANYMREAIDSAIAQTYRNIEIIVVNDGSNDNGATREIALSYGEKIRYFEKENGGVSTALNLAIREMSGEYFSWLSHDDMYYPDKIQTDIDALFADGDMTKAVYSDADSLIMPERQILRNVIHRNFQSYGKNVFEAGALTPALGFISGCTLLIPKQYFDIYGLFDESLRAVQDYKKWFEMFRGKRLIYIDNSLVQSRIHPQQTTNTYSRINDEEDWLCSWITTQMTQKDLEGSGIELYHFYGAMISKLRRGEFQYVNFIAAEKILPIQEPNQQHSDFSKHTFNSGKSVYLYCAGQRLKNAIIALKLRDIPIAGISDSNPEKRGQTIEGIPCIPPEHLPKDAAIIVTKAYPEDVEEMLKARGYKNIMAYDDLLGWILRTPVKKSLVEKFLREHKY